MPRTSSRRWSLSPDALQPAVAFAVIVVLNAVLMVIRSNSLEVDLN